MLELNVLGTDQVNNYGDMDARSPDWHPFRNLCLGHARRVWKVFEIAMFWLPSAGQTGRVFRIC